MRHHDQDELARTAGVLLDTVKAETNPKFKDSTFISLMRQLRDREVVVEGNQFVSSTGQIMPVPNTDIKGKAKATYSSVGYSLRSTVNATPFGTHTEQSDPGQTMEKTEDDLFWERENAEYAKFCSNAQGLGPAPIANSESWYDLQESWDNFEATTYGIRPVKLYQFQRDNPYLVEEFSSPIQRGRGPQGISEVRIKAQRRQEVDFRLVYLGARGHSSARHVICICMV